MPELAPWTGDETNQARLIVVGQSPALASLGAVAAIPAVYVEAVLGRTHLDTIAPESFDAHGRPVDWAAVQQVWTDWGVVHVYVDGLDVTWWRDIPAVIESWSSDEPFGDGPAAVSFPARTPFDVPGEGDLSWWRDGADVDLILLRPDATHKVLWSGFVDSEGSGLSGAGDQMALTCSGGLYQAAQAVPKATTNTDPVDIGTLITGALNSVTSRRYNPLTAVVTGITSRDKGNGQQSVLEYVQNLLATATTTDGTSQWTVKRTGQRTYAIALKNRTTENLSYRVGQHGFDGNLSRDLTSSPNVVYGRGIGPDGYAWAGWVYPNMSADTAPPYPNDAADNVITVGEDDGDTDSGTGVSDWERRVRDLGYSIAVNGVYSAADAETARDVQARFGIQVDGIIGPQTWAATFDVGANGGDLNGAYRRPIAIRPQVEPFTYTASGAISGDNPVYDTSIMRIERDINYGSGISKTVGTRSARADLARSPEPGIVGSLSLDVDPAEMSRHDITAGMNVRLDGWEGGELLLHVASVRHSVDGATSLMVDEHARDLLTLDAIIKRDAESAPDPARAPGSTRRRSQLAYDVAVEFDGESGAGVIPLHAMFGGLWNVLRIPVSQVGRIAMIEYTTTSPHAKFVMVLFGSPIQAADLVSIIGNPLADGNRSWQLEADALDGFGLIDGFGTPGQAMGYFPGSEGQGDALTGRMRETGGLEYVSQKPPWVWVAEYSPESCFGAGRIFPAPIQ